jgi:hypothetical protein
MQFGASAEVFREAYPALKNVDRLVEPLLNEAFERSSLANIDAMLRYVPIVMPEGMRERYPARSKLRKKQMIYDCAPQLNYDIFVSGTFEQQLREYMQGIESSAPHLAGLGATLEQIDEFRQIMSAVTDRILTEDLAETRH